LDLTVNVAEQAWPGFLAALTPRYQILVQDPLDFARRTRVLPVEAGGGVRADLIFAALSFELEALERAVTIPLEDRSVRICTAEDLILHKVISERQRDQDDVEGIVARQGRKLDLGYLTPRVRELASTLDRPDVESRYRSCLIRAGLESA
jgi:hypothetical protein